MVRRQKPLPMRRRYDALCLALVVFCVLMTASCGPSGSSSDSATTSTTMDEPHLLAASCRSLEAAIASATTSGDAPSPLILPRARAKDLEDNVKSILAAGFKGTLHDTQRMGDVATTAAAVLLGVRGEKATALSFLGGISSIFSRHLVTGSALRSETFGRTVETCRKPGLSMSTIDRVLPPLPSTGAVLGHLPWPVALWGDCRQTPSAANPVDDQPLEAVRCTLGSLPPGSNLGTDSPALVGDVAYLRYPSPDAAISVLREIAHLNGAALQTTSSGDQYVLLDAQSFMSITYPTLTLGKQCFPDSASKGSPAIGLMWAQQSNQTVGLVFDCFPWTRDFTALQALVRAHDTLQLLA
jgi:hypothetical protein